MIDLSTLEPGDKVRFRCGGEAEVYSVYRDPRNNYLVAFSKSDDLFFFQNGKFPGNARIIDIVEIIKPEKLVLEGWLNVYSDGVRGNGPYPSKEYADRVGNSGRIACLHIRQEYKRGEGL
jgi:hypothetical protein